MSGATPRTRLTRSSRRSRGRARARRARSSQSNETRTCFKCGKKGHTQANSRSAATEDETLGGKGKGQGKGPGKGKHIVLMAGDEEYRSEESMPQLAKILATHYGYTCTVLFSIDPATGLVSPNEHHNTPGLEALGSADLFIIGTRFRSPKDEQMAHIDKYLMSGKPVIGCPTPCAEDNADH